MHSLLLCVAATIFGGVGWQRLPDGGVEYIIQLDPQTLDSLRNGTAIQSDVPGKLGDIRSYRIQVGTKQLPRDPIPQPPKEPQPETPRKLAPSLSEKPLAGQQTSFAEPPPPAKSTAASATASGKTPRLPDTPAKPWLPLVFTLLGLFASFGANLFLGWVAWDSRRLWRLSQQGVQTISIRSHEETTDEHG